MSPRETASLALVVALLLYVGLVLPPRTDRLLTELRARIAEDPGARYEFYLSYLRTAAVGLALCALVVRVGGLGAGAFGLAAPVRLAPYAILALGLAALWLGALLAYVGAFAKDVTPERQWARVEFLVPRARRERTLWPVMCVAVAVLEEAVYRGLFVLWLAALLGVGGWWLVLPMAAVFGVAHQYQGWVGVAASTGLGAAFGVLTVGTRSLWPAVALHFLVDLRLLAARPPAPSP